MKLSLLLVLSCFLWQQTTQAEAEPSPRRREPIQLYGINYNTRQGPDADPNRCKSAELIETELRLLSKLTSRIRILSLIDCNQGEVILDLVEQEQLGLQIWLGLWVSPFEYVYQDELWKLQQLVDTGKIDPSTVLGLTVGSEAFYRGDVSMELLMNNRQAARNILNAAGLDMIPVAYCDISNTYWDHQQLIETSDVIFANNFAFWEQVPAENAVEHLANNPLWQKAQAENLPIILGETGWASAGYNPASSPATPQEQVQYFTDFYCELGLKQAWQYFWFTGIDNTWRKLQDVNGETGVEGHFGILYNNLIMKEHFANLEFTCPNNADSDVVYYFDLSADEVDDESSSDAPSQSTTLKNFPSASPSQSNTLNAPSATPSQRSVPSAVPSAQPSSRPSAAPSQIPSNVPSSTPSTREPTVEPSDYPSDTPSAIPSVLPSALPSTVPSNIPSDVPSNIPSSIPTSSPTEEEASSFAPSSAPSPQPSRFIDTLNTIPPFSIPPTPNEDKTNDNNPPTTTRGDIDIDALQQGDGASSFLIGSRRRNITMMLLLGFVTVAAQWFWG